MARATQYHKGKFTPKNYGKYRGDPTDIWYRSGWELRVMQHLDANSQIREWSSEEHVIPYVSPLDGRVHRYFPDFWVRTDSGEFIIEVKPEKQGQPPKARKRVTQKLVKEAATFAVNEAKWVAATAYCRKRGMEFKIMTERDIGLR